MIHSCRRLRLVAVAAAVLVFAGATPFHAVQQTREPPLFGEKLPSVVQPVPVVPAPRSVPIVTAPCPPVDPPTPVVKLRVRVAACSPAGQEIEYKICIENCSPAAAHHVAVRNPLPANARFVRANPAPAATEPELLWTFGTLQPGECKDITLVLSPTDTADIKNCARVQFEHGQCVVTRLAKAPPDVVEPPKEKPKDKEPPKVTEGDGKLALQITGPKRQYANLPVKYQITVTNNGDKPADNLLVTARLPEKSVYLAAGDGGRFDFGQVAWLLGTLPPGASKTVQVTYRVPAAGEFCLKVSALANHELRGNSEICTKFEGVSALLLESRDTKDPVGVGEQTSYRIVVTNQGTAPLTNVQVQVLVPPEFQLVRATGASSPPAQENLPPATDKGQRLAFAPLKEMKPGEKQAFEVFGKAVKPGDARWRVVVTADQLTAGPVMEEESTNVFREDGDFSMGKAPRKQKWIGVGSGN
jgi:uncharacterized repeat protein (TIGR01451 family)